MSDEAPLLVKSSEPVEEAAQQTLTALRDVGGAAPRLAVAGGSVQGAVGRLRQSMAGSEWSRLRLTWVDERRVPFDDGDSNRGSAYRARALDSSASPLDELPLYLDGETPSVACRRVEDAFLSRFEGALDVLLIG